MQRQPVIGSSVLYFERGEDNSIVLSPAIVTAVTSNDTVCLFVMRRLDTLNIENAAHGCEVGNWFYKGEFGI